MAACSLRDVTRIRGCHVYKETFEPSLADHVTFEWYNDKWLAVSLHV